MSIYKTYRNDCLDCKGTREIGLVQPVSKRVYKRKYTSSIIVEYTPKGKEVLAAYLLL